MYIPAWKRQICGVELYLVSEVDWSSDILLLSSWGEELSYALSGPTNM